MKVRVHQNSTNQQPTAMKVKIGEIDVCDVDRIEIGLLPGVAEHMNAMLEKISKDATSIETANAAMEIALWFKDHIAIEGYRHPNSGIAR